jgi:hypothetical protein
MNRTPTIVFGLLAILLWGYLLAFELGTGSEEPSVLVRDYLVRIPSDGVKSLRMEVAGTAFEFERTELNGYVLWKMTEPIQTGADQEVMSKLLFFLQYLERLGTPFPDAGAVDRKTLGLDPPEARVTVRTDMGNREIRLGTISPVDAETVYAQVQGAPGIHLVPIDFARYVFRDVTGFRRKSMFLADPERVLGVEVRNGGTTIQVGIESSDARWYLSQPWREPANEEMVSRLREVVTSLRVARFTDVPRDEAGLSEPVRVIKVYSRTPANQFLEEEVWIGNDVPGDTAVPMVYACTPKGSVVAVPKVVWTQIPLDPSAYRERRIWKGIADPQEVRLTGPNGEVVLGRQGEQWRVFAPATLSLDRDEPKAFLDTLKKMQISSFVADNPASLEPYGLTNPSATLSLATRDTSGTLKQETWRFGSPVPTGDPAYVVSERGTVYEIQPDLLTLFRKGWLLFHSRTVANLPDDKCVDLNVVNRAVPGFREPFHMQIGREPGQLTWRYYKPESAMNPEADRVILLNLVKSLRVREFLGQGKAMEEAYGLDRAIAEIIIRYGDERPFSRFRLKIGNPIGSAAFAATMGDGTVFALPAEAVDDIISQANTMVIRAKK